MVQDCAETIAQWDRVIILRGNNRQAECPLACELRFGSDAIVFQLTANMNHNSPTRNGSNNIRRL